MHQDLTNNDGVYLHFFLKSRYFYLYEFEIIYQVSICDSLWQNYDDDIAVVAMPELSKISKYQ